MKKQTPPDIAMVPVARGLHTAEGPVLLGDGSLLCCEVSAGQLRLYDASHDPIGNIEVGGGPNGAAIGPDGRCYVCNNGGISAAEVEFLKEGMAVPNALPSAGSIQAVDLETGDVETLFTQCEGDPLSAPNDLVFDAEGGFYFTDHGNLKDPAPLRGGVYYARCDGATIRRVDEDVERPNGIGLSPDGATLYVSETSSGRIWAYPVRAPGQADGSGRTLFYDGSGLNMDSLAIQKDGRVCVACPPQNIILRVGAGTVEHIPTPPGWPSNIAFAGPTMRTAYVTSIVSGEVWKAEWDSPGLPLEF